MDPSEANDRLPRDLIVAKLEAYGLAKESLHFIADYLTCRKLRAKVAFSYSD